MPTVTGADIAKLVQEPGQRQKARAMFHPVTYAPMMRVA